MTAGDVATIVAGVAILAVAAGVAWAGWADRPVGQRQVVAAERYLAQRRLPRDPELVVVTMRLQVALARAGYRTMAVCFTVLGVAAALVPFVPGDRWLAVIWVPLFFLLALVLLLVFRGRALRRHDPRAGGPHVTHGARPRVTDYVVPLVVWWPAIAVAAGGVAVADLVRHPVAGAAATRVEILVAWAAGSLGEAAILALAFWLAAQPQPAASAGELAVRNELTSDVLSRLLLCPLLGYTLFYVGRQTASTAMTIVCLVLIGAQLFAYSRHEQVRKRLFAAHPRPPLPQAGS